MQWIKLKPFWMIKLRKKMRITVKSPDSSFAWPDFVKWCFEKQKIFIENLFIILLKHFLFEFQNFCGNKMILIVENNRSRGKIEAKCNSMSIDSFYSNVLTKHIFVVVGWIYIENIAIGLLKQLIIWIEFHRIFYRLE